MGAFNWLKKMLEEQQQTGCALTAKAEKFVKDYDEQVDAAKRSLRERQVRDRKEQS